MSFTAAQVADLIEIAASNGPDAATAAMAEMGEQNREARLDSEAVAREDLHGDYADNDAYMARTYQGCGADDTLDSRGKPLLPLVNDAGEHIGM